MTPEQKAAYIQAQAACAMAEIAGMQAENQHRLSHGYSIAYGEEAFASVADKYVISNNAVLAFLQE